MRSPLVDSPLPAEPRSPSPEGMSPLPTPEPEEYSELPEASSSELAVTIFHELPEVPAICAWMQDAAKACRSKACQLRERMSSPRAGTRMVMSLKDRGGWCRTVDCSDGQPGYRLRPGRGLLMVEVHGHKRSRSKLSCKP